MRTVRILLLTGLLPVLALARHPERLTVYWGVLANQDNGRARWELTLVNQDTVALPASGWTLYFNFMRPILPESTPPSVRLTHVNGDFYRLEPTEAFAPLPPGGRRTLSFESPGPLIKAIDAPRASILSFATRRTVRFRCGTCACCPSPRSFRRGGIRPIGCPCPPRPCATTGTHRFGCYRP
ncbi:carbohydate-binding domain-containing protein, partial [Rhodothermus marinus]|uniref:carbohydate-binding domain-containing protein n=1 Tax=Rhodothermus marinus TaxID=29549 RepID=UPI000AC06B02